MLWYEGRKLMEVVYLQHAKHLMAPLLPLASLEVVLPAFRALAWYESVTALRGELPMAVWLGPWEVVWNVWIMDTNHHQHRHRHRHHQHRHRHRHHHSIFYIQYINIIYIYTLISQTFWHLAPVGGSGDCSRLYKGHNIASLPWSCESVSMIACQFVKIPDKTCQMQELHLGTKKYLESSPKRAPKGSQV